MKKKIISRTIDILLIMVVFYVKDIVLLKVFHSENRWFDLGIYIVFYAIVFGAKSGIVLLWYRFVSKNKKEEGNDDEKN